MMQNPASARCRACGTDVPPGATKCPRCGTSQSADLCPHCGATAGASPDEELRWRCDICGGPRVPLADPRVRRTGRENKALERAEAARKARAWSRAGAVVTGLALTAVLGVVGIVAALGAAGAFNLGFGFVLAALLTAGPLSGFLLWLVMRARARGKEIEPALDAAWMAVATDVVQQSKEPVTPRALADALRIEESQAEELLALLEASDIVRGDISDAGALTYQPRMRIDAGADRAAQAEAEALAEAEAMQEAGARAQRERL
ncbi:zinc ribbon domain-containing protein [Polyangium aurulentum]|nr:zinc ribbon domain-containing protein [Polyangium aurulentum]